MLKISAHDLVWQCKSHYLVKYFFLQNSLSCTVLDTLRYLGLPIQYVDIMFRVKGKPFVVTCWLNILIKFSKLKQYQVLNTTPQE